MSSAPPTGSVAAPPGQTTPQGSSGNTPQGSSGNNLQRIAHKKSQVKAWPLNKKLEKLAIYSSCKADDGCKCNGWKNPNLPQTPQRLEGPQPLANLNDPCRSCLVRTFWGHMLFFYLCRTHPRRSSTDYSGLWWTSVCT
uniref:Putative histone acetyltransferase kat2a gallus gallus gcn5 n=1 Tax=Ixodes ricinus TaxID=34613 RepID=A0A0K8RAL2_IXORI